MTNDQSHKNQSYKNLLSTHRAGLRTGNKPSHHSKGGPVRTTHMVYRSAQYSDPLLGRKEIIAEVEREPVKTREEMLAEIYNGKSGIRS